MNAAYHVLIWCTDRRAPLWLRPFSIRKDGRILRRTAPEAIPAAASIKGKRLSGGSGAIVLLANSLSTGAALVALILPSEPFRARTSILQSPAALPCKRVFRVAKCRSISGVRLRERFWESSPHR
jgi:hypothetical protein